MDDAHNRTRAARGSRTPRAAPAPAHAAEPAPSASHQPLAVMASRVLGARTKRLLQQAAELRDRDDATAVHDLRVTVRRVRTWLRLLEDAPCFHRGDVRSLRHDLRALARALGCVRDADILAGRVAQLAREDQTDAALHTTLLDALASRQVVARTTLRATLDAPKTRRAVHHLEQLADNWMRQEDGPPLLVRHFAGAAIWRQYQDVLAFERFLPGMSLERLHRLRIGCKRLRYTLEFFGEALAPGADPLIATLTAAQDHLGALQDARTGLAAVESLRDEASQAVVATLTTPLARDCAALREAFPPVWETLSNAPLRHALAALVADL